MGEHKQSAAEASITSLAIFIAICLAILGLLITQTQANFGYNAPTVASFSLVFAIALLVVAIEFFILCISHPDRDEYFGFIGSTMYGIAVALMILAISLTLETFQMHFFAYLILSAALLLYSVYYGIRIKSLVSEEGLHRGRIIVRGIWFTIIVVGYILVSTVGG